MNYNQTLKKIYALSKYGKLGLKRIRKLLKKLDNPEKKLKIIHVAGTNGKGSVSAMVSSILQEAGYKVGLYTSPHLINFTERIKINNKEISKKDVIKYYKIINKEFEKQSYFEFITAMAFLYFHGKKIDFAVIETGLGGRLDATNVVIPLISVITNIELEHTRRLGNTLTKIAYEKSGIIKRNKPVVTGATGIALKEIRRIAKKRNSKLVLVKNFNYKTNLLGKHQIQNANIAVTAIKSLNLEINDAKIKKGLKKVHWPGRLQYLSKNVLVDVAHNPSGMEALAKYLKTLNKKVILVFGCSEGKDYKKMLKPILPLSKKVILTKAKIKHKDRKALDPKIISEEIIKSKKDFIIINNSKKALIYSKKTAKQDLILVTGSIFLVGEILP